jgi:hypothetical protein
MILNFTLRVSYSDWYFYIKALMTFKRRYGPIVLPAYPCKPLAEGIKGRIHQLFTANPQER